jgi:hypothetical protein
MRLGNNLASTSFSQNVAAYRSRPRVSQRVRDVHLRSLESRTAVQEWRGQSRLSRLGSLNIRAGATTYEGFHRGSEPAGLSWVHRVYQLDLPAREKSDASLYPFRFCSCRHYCSGSARLRRCCCRDSIRTRSARGGSRAAVLAASGSLLAAVIGRAGAGRFWLGLGKRNTFSAGRHDDFVCCGSPFDVDDRHGGSSNRQ